MTAVALALLMSALALVVAAIALVAAIGTGDLALRLRLAEEVQDRLRSRVAGLSDLADLILQVRR